MMEPTYKFHEALELVRMLDKKEEFILLWNLVIEEKTLYCLYDVNVIIAAIKIRLDFISRGIT